MNGAEALTVIAEVPGGKGKTPTDLREAAAECERKAIRKDRLIVAESSNRRRARVLARQRESQKLRVYGQIARVAAEEVERRKAQTVGEAMQHRVVRFFRQMLKTRNRFEVARG